MEKKNTNHSLTECGDRTGEYWPEVVAVRTELSEVCSKTTNITMSYILGQSGMIEPHRDWLILIF